MIRPLLRLFRPRLALLNGVAVLGGYLLFSAEIDLVALSAVFSGVVLLAAAGSAFNQVLERDVDRLMQRTRLRPLPQGELTVLNATLIAGTAALAGLALLSAGGGRVCTLLGLAALCWYLAVYTPLKRLTPYALVAGALCGAVPPLIGWSAAGGEPWDYRVMFLAGLMYLWQIPHFWLIQRRHADDYRCAGIPLLKMPVQWHGFYGLLVVWLLALVTAAMLLPAFGMIGHPATLWYTIVSFSLMLTLLLRSEKVLFSCLNLLPLLVTLLLCLQR